MRHQVIPLFALPVTRLSLDHSGVGRFFDEVIKPSVGRNNTDGTGAYKTPLVHYHNEANVFDLYDELSELGDRILSAAQFVYRDVMNHDSELRITNAWFNECEIGGRQFMHNHCNSVISGTLYLRVDENSYIQFQTPFGMNDYGNMLLDEANTRRPNRFGYGHHFSIATVTVKPGDCLFWPSHLRHGYAENLTPGRLTLSVNFLPKTFNCVYSG
jgi:uncharacterized protein (TIGR02466 family)